MQISKSCLSAAFAAAAVLTAGIVGAQVLDANVVNGTLDKNGSIMSQIPAQKDLAAAQTADMIEADRGGGHGGGHGGPGRGGPGRGPGHEPGHQPGHEPGRGPGHIGHGDWGRWHGHPGWGYGRRWDYRDGRWLWWGWAAWTFGHGACDVYYAGSYRQCSDAAWADNASCVTACQGAQDCNAACADETRNAINSCEWSYRNVWNCGFAPVWPPIGIVIRIP